MTKLKQFREKNPAYDDMPDDQLVSALHQKYYSDIPKAEFDSLMGYVSPPPEPGLIDRGIGAVREAFSGTATGDAPTVRAHPGEQVPAPAKRTDTVMADAPLPDAAPRATPANEKQRQFIKASYDNYPESRAGLLARKDWMGDIARQIDAEYKAGDAATANLPTAQGLDSRQESRVSRNIGQGMKPDTAMMTAQSQAAVGEDAPAGQITETPDTLADKVAREYGDSDIVRGAVDLAGSVAKVAPTTGKMALDTLQLVPLIGRAAEMGSDALAEVIEDISKGQSSQMQGKATQLAEVVRNGTPDQVMQLVLQNPDLLADVAIPSAGSIFLIGGAGGAIGKGVASKYAGKVSPRALARIQQRAATDGAVWTNAAVNAGAAYDETDGSETAKYTAALIAGLGTRAVGKMTAGGAEGAIARGSSGASNPIYGAARIGAGEMAQEFGEGSSEAFGVQTGEIIEGTRDGYNVRQIANQGTLESVAAGPMGGAVGAMTSGGNRNEQSTPLDAAGNQGQGADPRGSAGLASDGRVGAAGGGQSTGAPARSGEPGVAVGTTNPVSDAALAIDAKLQQREAEAFARDPVEGLVAQAENAAVRQAATPPQTDNGIDIDQDALLAAVEARMTPSGNVIVEGDNAAQLVRSIVPQAPMLPRADGAVMVSVKFAGPVMEAIQGAKQRVSVAFGGDGAVDAPDVAEFKAQVSQQKETGNAPQAEQVAQEAQAASGQEGAQSVEQAAEVAQPTQPAKPKPSRLKADPALAQRAAPVADDLRAMSQDAGWAEEGGKLIRDAEGKASRTKWIPRAEWFVSGMEADPATLAQHIEDMYAGRGVPAKSRRTIEGMIEWLDRQRGATTPTEDSSAYDFEAIGFDVMSEPARLAVDAFDDFDAMTAEEEAAAMRALGFTEEEIRNGQGQTAEGQGGSRADDAGREAAGNQGDAGTDSTQADSGAEAGQEGLTLSSYTNEDIAQQETAQREQDEAAAKAEREAVERERKAREQAEVRARSAAAANTFELGMDPMANLTGQGDIFSPAAEPAQEPETAADGATYTQGKGRASSQWKATLEDGTEGNLKPTRAEALEDARRQQQTKREAERRKGEEREALERAIEKSGRSEKLTDADLTLAGLTPGKDGLNDWLVFSNVVRGALSMKPNELKPMVREALVKTQTPAGGESERVSPRAALRIIAESRKSGEQQEVASANPPSTDIDASRQERAIRILLDRTDGNGSPDALSGPEGAEARIEIVSALTGRSAEDLKSDKRSRFITSVAEVERLLHEAAGVEGGSISSRRERFLDWIDSREAGSGNDRRKPEEKRNDRRKAKVERAAISDFGEKIGGARKDVWSSFKDKLTEVSDGDIATQPLSKSWPAPDYQAMLNEGADPWAVAMIRSMRDAIPTKPQKGYKVKQWAELVKMLRDVASGALDGNIREDSTRRIIGQMASRSRHVQDIMGRIDLYLAVGHDKSLAGVRLEEHFYTLYKGRENVNLWAVEQDAKATAFSNWPRELATGDTKEEAIAAFKAKYDSLNINEPAAKQVSFDIYSKTGEKGYWIGKKVGRNYIDLERFDTLKEAREYKNTNTDKLTEKLEKAKEIPRSRPDTNAPRVGVDMRNAQDVTPEMFSDAFGFKGVEFGNYVEQKRRQQDLNDAYDALMDMAAILGVPPKALSLNGELGLAFGARGKGGIEPASAHYEPGKVVINLTKGNGAGSLGHEWWHALDNYFSRMRGKAGDMTTEALDVSLAERGSEFAANTKVRREMVQAFGEVMKAISQTALRERSYNLDRRRSKEYWTTKPEMSARAFESYLISKLQDQNASNDYLANIVDETTWKAAEALGWELGGSYPYPTAGEVPAIRSAFDNFFNVIESKETGKGVMLFSRAGTSQDLLDKEVARWSEIVEQHLTGQLDRTRTHILLTETPASMQALGLPNLQVRTGPHMMDYANVRLTRDQMDSLPREIANPRLAYIHDGNNGLSINFVTSIERNGEHVVIALKPNQHVREAGNAHFVATIVNVRTDRIVGEFRKGHGLYVSNKDALPGLRDATDFAQKKNGRRASEVREQMSRNYGLASLVKRLIFKSDLVNIIQRGQAQYSFAGQNPADDSALTPAGLRAAVESRYPSLAPAVDVVLKRGEEGKPGGVVLIDSNDDRDIAAALASKTGRSIETAMSEIGANDTYYSDDGGIQGFYDTESGLTFLVAPNLDTDTAPAVLLHEAMHGKQRDDIDRRALALIESRGKAVKPVREFLARVYLRMQDAGEVGNASEASAYLVEQAVIEGKRFSAADGKLLYWIDRKLGKRVGDIVRDFVAMVRAWGMKRGMNLKPSVDDLVALAMDNLREMAKGRVVTDGNVLGRSTAGLPSAIEVDGIERPTRNSNSQPIHPTEDGIRNFWQWFGDSKAVDDEGRPLVVYHGTNAKFDTFDLGYAEREDSWSFSTSKDVAQTYQLQQIDPKRAFDAYQKASSAARKAMDAELAEIAGDDGVTLETFEAWAEEANSDDPQLWAQDLGDAAGVPASEFFGPSPYGQMIEAYLKITNPIIQDFNGTADPQSESRPKGAPDGYILRNVMDTNSPGAAWLYSDVFKVLSSDQIKSATGNNGQFNQSDSRINFSRAARTAPAMAMPTAAASPAAQPVASSPARANQQTVTPPEETRFQAAQRRTQDKLNRFTVIKEWLADQGVKLSEQADVYKAEERMHSRFSNKAEDFREKTVRPLVEKIQKAGYAMEDVAQFLHAQHAKERNEQIARINPQMPDGGSGMKTADAAKVMASASPELKALANEFRSITEQTKRVLLDAGLLSQDMADAWSKAYQHYVPLKGGPDTNIVGAGKGLKAKYKPKRALGHGMREEGEWIVENILADHERALMLAEKNRVGQSLIQMAIEAGRDDLITVSRPQKRAILKENVAYEVLFKGKPVGSFTSLEAARAFRATAPAAMKNASPSHFAIRKTSDPAVVYTASPMLADNEVEVYVKGQAIRVQINDELLARAYGNMGVEALSSIMRVGSMLNSYLSRIYTGYNPEFILTNIIRDFTTGVINITGEEGAAMAAKAIKNYVPSFISLFKYAVTRNPDQWIADYRADGGNTGAAYLSDLERLGEDVMKEYAAFKGVAANIKAGDVRGAVRAAGRKVFDKTLIWIERVNQAGENAMRLAVYRAMRESGQSRAAAASLAKNATVNFNRKGELGQRINAMYLFYNAGVQGSAAILHANIKGKHKYQANAVSAGMMALGYVMASALGGDDEEKEYDQLSGYTKARNMVIKAGEGWVKVPVPYGYGFFWNLGRSIADAQRKDDLGNLPWQVATSFIEEFTPFGNAVGEKPDGEHTFLYSLPTIAQIIGAPLMNKSGMGGPIYPESGFDGSQPDREKMWRATKGTMADGVAGALEMAGLDVSPETIKFLARTFTGGAGSLASTAVDSTWLKLNGADLEVKEMPFVRKLYTETDVRDARRVFWESAKEARQASEAFDRARKVMDLAKITRISNEDAELLAMDRMADKYGKAIRAHRDWVDRIRNSETYSIAEKRMMMKDVETQERKLYEQYIEVFGEAMDRRKARQ